MTDTRDELKSNISVEEQLGSGKNRIDWRTLAVCANISGDIFFPDIDESTKLAIEICESCPVKKHCLTHALEQNENLGIWGGKTEEERETMRRKITRETYRRPGLRKEIIELVVERKILANEKKTSAQLPRRSTKNKPVFSEQDKLIMKHLSQGNIDISTIAAINQVSINKVHTQQ